jgi:hypothetical protein
MALLNTPLFAEDFAQYPWQDVIAASARKECSEYHAGFAQAVSEAEAAGDEKAQAVYGLLEVITSLYFDPRSDHDPLVPGLSLLRSRTSRIYDLADVHLDALQALLPSVPDPELRARAADILWLRSRRSGMIRDTLIDAYLRTARALEDPEHWPACADRIERARQIGAESSRDIAGYTEVFDYIEEVLGRYDGEDPYVFSAVLMRSLLDNRRGEPVKYAALSAKAAQRAEQRGLWNQAETYWTLEARWRQFGGDEEGRRDALIRAADTHVGNAAEAANADKPEYIGAAARLQSAIEAHRRIGGQQERVRELRRLLLEYQEHAAVQMQEFEHSVDLGPLIREGIGAVEGRDLLDALLGLARLPLVPRVADLRAFVDENSQDLSFRHLFSSAIVDERGRVLARIPAMTAGNPDDVEAATRAEMFHHLRWYLELYAMGAIRAAVWQINSERHARVEDLLPLASNNPLVPEGRELIYAEGLRAGLKGNFLVATHLLIPQLEHSLRETLYGMNVVPSGLDAAGVQTEWDLNTTLYLPETRQLLGEDLTFTLQGLLVSQFGSNLRNQMAHGLLSRGAFYSYAAIYLWWVVVRMLYMGLLSQADAGTSAGRAAEERAPAGGGEASAQEAGGAKASPTDQQDC